MTYHVCAGGGGGGGGLHEVPFGGDGGGGDGGGGGGGITSPPQPHGLHVHFISPGTTGVSSSCFSVVEEAIEKHAVNNKRKTRRCS